MNRQAGRQAGSNKRASGFTLIELVVVIVILGILAATALPKFVDLSKDARVAAVEGLKGAIWSAASMGQSKCAVSSTCNLSSHYNEATKPYITIGSTVILTHFGWPCAWGRDTTTETIAEMLNLSGFTVKPSSVRFNSEQIQLVIFVR